MKSGILKTIIVFAVFVVLFALLRIAFILWNLEIYSDFGLRQILASLSHALPMDCSVSGYFTVIPALIFTVEIFTGVCRITKIILKSWFAIVSALMSFIFVLDATLYPYWGFRLETTPFFYFFTSPSAAFASIELWQLLLAILIFITLSAAIWCILVFCVFRVQAAKTLHRFRSLLVMLLLTALLFIPIRGGLGLSPMNVSRAYFSSEVRLNHAAINPVFNLIYATLHQNDDYGRFRFMSDEEAERVIESFSESLHKAGKQVDTTLTLTYSETPDIWLFILESFSSHLLPSMGGEPIAIGLDSIAESGFLFTNFYANSFRTDRALPSILSGFPALPTMSILKYVDKTEHLPSIAASLSDIGYSTNFYYGGDINFANFKAYLIATGFDNIISGDDFPSNLNTSKWGINDGDLFGFVKNKCQDTKSPFFNVVQTSSSHEPFEVPYKNERFFNSPQKNAFVYTDSCLTSFINYLSATPSWNNTIVAIVPDHLGAWPLNLPDAAQRHHIPFIITGGALNSELTGCKSSRPGSQADIAATLLSALNVNSDDFAFSRNLFDHHQPGIAIFSEPEVVGIVSDSDTLVYNINTNSYSGTSSKLAKNALKAILQKQYKAAAEL